MEILRGGEGGGESQNPKPYMLGAGNRYFPKQPLHFIHYCTVRCDIYRQQCLMLVDCILINVIWGVG